MKDLGNCTIEFSYSDIGSGNMRYIYWRIKPKELSFWKRLFKNPWRTLEREVFGNWNPIWSVYNYKEYNVQSLKTYSDILNFENREWDKIIDYRQEMIEQGKMWEDDLHNYRVDYI